MSSPGILVVRTKKGQLLRQLLAGPRTDEQREALLGSLRQCCQAIQARHAQGELHGALDPSRIWCFDDGEVQLLPATREPEALYASPERRRGEPLDARADLYPIGVILYEILTGVAPSEDATRPLVSSPMPPNLRWSGCPLSLSNLCLGLLEQKRERRPQTMGEVLWRLQELHTESPLPRAEATPPSTRAQTVQATYEVLEELGSDSGNRIVRAVDLRLGREIALKESLHTSPAAVEQFYREALITARLEHPAIVPVHEVGRWSDGAPFYAMKRINGQPLNEALQGLSLQERLPLLPRVLDAAEAISYAHSKGIIHRNLKPQNILIGEFGETVVIGWGTAKDLRGQLSTGLSEVARGLGMAPHQVPQRTSSGRILPSIQSAMTPTNPLAAGSAAGTPAYMSPEQVEGIELDERADVYALGAILYHLLANQPPYPSSAPTGETLAQVLRAAPAPLEQRAPEVPKELCAIVSKAMARSPSKRYPSASELCQDLERFLSGGMVRAHRYTFIDALRHKVARYRAAFFVASFFFVALLVVGLYSTKHILAAKTAAEESAAAAKTQQRIAMERLELLALSQARALVAQSPSKALSALKLLSPDSKRWRAARTLAAEVMRHSGASLAFSGLQGNINYACLIPNSQAIATAEDHGVVQIWDTLINQARIFESPAGDASFVACAPNGRLIAATYEDKSVQVIDLKSGQTSLVYRSKGVVLDLVFSPDSKRLAVADQDGPIDLISISTGGVEHLANPKRVMRSVQFSPDGRYLAAVGSLSQALLFDLVAHTSEDLPNPGDLQRVRFSPDGKWMATASYTQGLSLWNIKQQTALRLDSQPGEIWHLDFSPDSATLASVGQDKHLWIWDISTCSGDTLEAIAQCGQGRALEGHQSSIRGVSFSDDGRWLATASMDRTARVWDTHTWDSRSLEGHEDVVARAYFLPGAEHLVTTSWDGSLRLWDLVSAEKVWRDDTAQPSRHAALSPDGLRLATHPSEDVLNLTNTKTGEVRRLDTSDLKSQFSLFSPDGKHLLLTGKNGAQLRNSEGTLQTWLEGDDDGQVFQGAFSPDGRLIATTSADTTTRVWSLSGKTSVVLPRSQERGSLSFSPDGEYLAVVGVGEAPKLVLWRSACFALIAQEQSPREECTPAYVLDAPDGDNERPIFSPDGRLLTITNNKLHAIVVVELATQQQTILPSHGTYALHQAFSPDSKLMATVGLDTSVRLWDTSSWTYKELTGHQNYIGDVSFSPDGKTLVAGGYDQTIRLWDIESVESRSLPAPDKEIIRVFFSQQGDEVISVSALATIRVWPDNLPNQPEAFWQWLNAKTQ